MQIRHHRKRSQFKFIACEIAEILFVASIGGGPSEGRNLPLCVHDVRSEGYLNVRDLKFINPDCLENKKMKTMNKMAHSLLRLRLSNAPTLLVLRKISLRLLRPSQITASRRTVTSRLFTYRKLTPTSLPLFPRERRCLPLASPAESVCDHFLGGLL